MSRIELEIPESVYSRLEQTIISTVEKTLQRHVEKIQAEPQMLTRQETAAMLKVSLPTLRKLEHTGELLPQRSGRKLLYDRQSINQFLRQ